jgi:hypothetical protein
MNVYTVKELIALVPIQYKRYDIINYCLYYIFSLRNWTKNDNVLGITIALHRVCSYPLLNDADGVV